MSDTLLTGEQKYYSLIQCTYQTFAFDMSVSLLLHVSDTIVFVSYKLNTIDEKQWSQFLCIHKSCIGSIYNILQQECKFQIRFIIAKKLPQ